MAKLSSTPGDPEVWLVDGEYYLVYVYDLKNVEGEIPVAWKVTQRDLQARFGQGRPIQVDRKYKQSGMDRTGALTMGSADDLSNFTEDPLNTWVTQITREAEVRPWLRDPEMLGKVFGAYMEGRQLTNAEMEQTEWWRSHNEAQRQWALLVESDPMTAERIKSDMVATTKDMAASLDIHGLNGQVYNWLADQVVSGNWSQRQLEHQMAVLANPEHPGKLDAELSQVMKGAEVDVRHTRQYQDEVRNMAVEWLGPRFGQLSDKAVERWANRIRDDQGAIVDLEDMLRKQRLSVLPQYENESLTYEDIVAPWRQEFRRSWGQDPDEMNDPFWMKVVRSGDVNQAGELLRREGWDRGVDQVMNDTEKAMAASFSEVRSPIF